MSNDEPKPDPGSDGPAADGPAVPAVPAEPDAPRESPPGRVAVPVAVPVTVALVLGLAIGLIAGWLLPRPGDDSSDGGSAAAAGADDPVVTAEPGSQPVTILNPTAPSPVEGGPTGSDGTPGLVIGSGDQVVEVFEDYVCPFCARFELSNGAQLREAALDGDFRLVVHPIAFLTEDSPRAANASACVFEHDDLDTWASFHETVYERQDPTESEGQYTNEVLLDVADEVGASRAAAECIADGDFLDWVTAITRQAFERGVRGTPTLAVDGTVTDVAPFVQ